MSAKSDGSEFSSDITRERSDLVCPLLKDFFGRDIKCTSLEDSFTKPSGHSQHTTTSSTSQYFFYVPSLSETAFTLKKLCPPTSTACKDAATSLLSASYLDIDYSAASSAVIINVFWDKAPITNSWTESVFLPGTQERVEVGVLSHEKNPDPEDIAFAGFLTVLGQDTQPSKHPLSLSLSSANTYLLSSQSPLVSRHPHATTPSHKLQT